MISISSNTSDFSNYLERRLDRDIKLEATKDDLWANLASIILEKVSDMWPGPFSISPLLSTYA